jgi:hypothetical protein
MIICIFSAYEDDEGILVYEPKTVMLNYFQGWFIFDLTASIPFDLILDDCNLIHNHNILSHE